MKHRRTQRFFEAFKALPKAEKERARKAFRLFQQDMSHPSLHIELIEGTDGIWSGRISRKYRWTFHFEVDAKTGERVCVHRAIGPHEIVYRNP